MSRVIDGPSGRDNQSLINNISPIPESDIVYLTGKADCDCQSQQRKPYRPKLTYKLLGYHRRYLYFCNQVVCP